MSARFGTLTVLFLGLPLFVGTLRLAAGQEAAANAPDQPQLRTWTDRSGEHRTEASFVEMKVTLKKKDGTTVTVPLSSLSEADQEYVKCHTSGDELASEPTEEEAQTVKPKQRGPSSRRGSSGNVAEISLSGGRKSTSAALPEVKEVVITGVGTTTERAIQNAFSHAIEQTVGVLVDAETVVKNDQLIRDDILTYSRGYVETYEVVKQWRDDSLHHATIRAVVARNKLAEKLRGMRIAVHEVAGDLASRQFDFDAKNEKQAAEMFGKALADLDMTKLTKVVIPGKPEIVREGENAKVRIKVRISPDLQQWRTFSPTLRGILTKVATRHAATTLHHDSSEFGSSSFEGAFGKPGEQLKNQLRGEGVLIGLLTNVSANGDKAQWEVFRVPEPIGEAVKAANSGIRYQLVCSLLDDQGHGVVRTAEPMEEKGFDENSPHESVYPLDNPWWIGPVWNRHGSIKTLFDTELVVALANEDLNKVAKTVVFLEKDTKHEK